MTPSGKPVKVGVVVATPALAGGATQQWICDADVGPDKPENVTEMLRVCAAVPRVTLAKPVPPERTLGFSFAPERVVVNVCISAKPGTPVNATTMSHDAKQRPCDLRLLIPTLRLGRNVIRTPAIESARQLSRIFRLVVLGFDAKNNRQ